MRDTLLVRLAAVLCRAENDGAQARASCLPAVGGAALQLTKRPGRKPSGAASGGFCKSLIRENDNTFTAIVNHSGRLLHNSCKAELSMTDQMTNIYDFSA